jgi:1-acyl-sn-glycerol-3-phosphate acyltransferase
MATERMSMERRLAASTDDTAQALLGVLRGTLEDLRGRGAGAMHVSLDSRLDRDLGLDSLARVELLARIEQTFGVQLADTVLQTAETPRDLLFALGTTARPSALPLARAVRKPALLPQDEGEPFEARTLPEAIAWHVERHSDVAQITLLGEAAPETITYGLLWQQASAVAGALQDKGLGSGQTVALMLPTSAEYFYAFLGVMLAGGVPVPMYPPARASQIEEHVRRHAGILANAGAQILIAAPEVTQLARLLQMHVPGLRTIETVGGLLAAKKEPVRGQLREDSIAMLQYTSGSTGQPKGVILTHANLLANIRAMGATVRISSSDLLVSWLPLYHDMGLIGAWMATMYYGCPLVLMSPLSFLTRPARWLWAIHEYRGTLAPAPNFAFELCVKRVKDEEIEGLDLSSWRLAINGAEAVMPATLERFQQRFGRYGLRTTVMTPVYGLAECAVGLAFPPLDRGPRIDCIDRDIFMSNGVASAVGADATNPLRFVSCGRPLVGHQVRAVDETGREVPERIEGRLEFKGPSATRGYFANPQATARVFRDGWLDTGDRGYFADGELFVTGRIKDIIIRAGRHVHPEELEEAVGDIQGIRKGCVAVFGNTDSTTGTERVVVLAETRESDASARDALRARVTQRVAELLGEPPDEVVLAEPHAVLKTSSGKIRRAASRELYESGGRGVQPRAVWWQVLRLAATALVPNLRRWYRRSGEILFGGYFWTLTVLVGAVTWLLAAVQPDPARVWAISHGAARLLIRAARIPCVIRGIDNLPQSEPCVVVCNHASYIDSLFMLAALPRPFSFVAKLELAPQFFAGTYLRRLGAEFVERFDVRAGVAAAEHLYTVARGGRSFVFYPEGTFSRAPGLMPFHLGAFMTAAEAGVKVVPVALRGTRSMMRDKQWLPRRVPVVVDIGAPIPPSHDGDAFTRAVRLSEAARDHIRARCGEPDTVAPP